MTVAEELWDQLVYLSDPSTKWVHRMPRFEGEACLLLRYDGSEPIGVNVDGMLILSGLVKAERDPRSRPITVVGWNDKRATREQVLHVLEEAYWWAKEEGL